MNKKYIIYSFIALLLVSTLVIADTLKEKDLDVDTKIVSDLLNLGISDVMITPLSCEGNRCSFIISSNKGIIINKELFVDYTYQLSHDNITNEIRTRQIENTTEVLKFREVANYSINITDNSTIITYYNESYYENVTTYYSENYTEQVNNPYFTTEIKDDIILEIDRDLVINNFLSKLSVISNSRNEIKNKTSKFEETKINIKDKSKK